MRLALFVDLLHWWVLRSLLRFGKFLLYLSYWGLPQLYFLLVLWDFPLLVLSFDEALCLVDRHIGKGDVWRLLARFDPLSSWLQTGRFLVVSRGILRAGVCLFTATYLELQTLRADKLVVGLLFPLGRALVLHVKGHFWVVLALFRLWTQVTVRWSRILVGLVGEGLNGLALLDSHLKVMSQIYYIIIMFQNWNLP